MNAVTVFLTTGIATCIRVASAIVARAAPDAADERYRYQQAEKRKVGTVCIIFDKTQAPVSASS